LKAQKLSIVNLKINVENNNSLLKNIDLLSAEGMFELKKQDSNALTFITNKKNIKKYMKQTKSYKGSTVYYFMKDDILIAEKSI